MLDTLYVDRNKSVTRWLSKLSLRFKLAALTAIPLLALIWFQIDAAVQRADEVEKVSVLNHLAGFSASADDLIHVLQLERGATAVYVSTQGETFSAELEEFRKNTDEQLAKFDEVVNEQSSKLSEDFIASTNTSLEALSELQEFRDAVTALEINRTTAVDYYTDVNHQLLHTIEAARVASPDPKLATEVLALGAITEAKEKVGIERALMANVFGADVFVSGEREELISLISAKESYFDIFLSSATPELSALFISTQTNPVVAEVKNLERLAIDNGDAEFGVEAEAWFKLITTRIELLREIEQAQEAEITETASSLTQAAHDASRKAIASVTLVLLFTLILVWVIARQIVAQLNTLSSQAERIAEGDLSLEDLDFPGRDPVAQLGGSFNRMTRALRLVRNQLSALAARDLKHQSLTESFPGELGLVMNELVHDTQARVELERRERRASARTVQLLENETQRTEELNQISLALSKANDRFKALVHNSFEVILVIDSKGILVYASGPFETIFGRRSADFLGKPTTEIVNFMHEDDRVSTRALFTELNHIPDEVISSQYRYQHEDRSWHWLDFTMRNLLGDDAVSGIVVNVRDITEQKNAAIQLEQHAYHDVLTGLPNRRLLIDRLEHALAHKSRHGGTIALIYLDLDDFKTINDSMGHAAGDQLLLTMARRIQFLTRTTDTAARFGGDEFVILCDDLKGSEEVSSLAQRIISSISEPIKISGKYFSVTTSMGIAIDTDGAVDSKSLLAYADAAMYRAKQLGKNRFEIHSSKVANP